MIEYIEKEAAVQIVKEKIDMTPDEKAGVIVRLNAIPAVDVQPVVCGKWLGVWWDSERAFGQCSNCHNTGELRTNRTEYGIWEINMRFCPDCGAVIK